MTANHAGDARSDELKDRTVHLLEAIAPAPRPFDVRFWDGTLLAGCESGTASATLVLREPGALVRALEPPIDLSAGEAFVHGEIDVEGDLAVVFEAADALLDDARRAPLLRRLRTAGAVAGLRRRTRATDVSAKLRGRKHAPRRDASAVRYHYDLPVAFYRLWLDRRMTYSCGYFVRPDATLDQAQEAKLELVCRKLRLRSGHRLLDIGCGWGSLVQWAAERYGAVATGVTLAENQVAEARVRLAEAGLDDRTRVERRDYRDLDGTFDRIASVGMSEHVGRAGLERYFRAAWDRLVPGGLMLNHAIDRGPTGVAPAPDTGGNTFIQRYVFPDGEIVDLAEVIRAAEAVGFEVRDVEDLREHYATTLRHWVRNLESAWEEAVRQVGDERARVWRLFMAGCAHQFDRGRLAVHQVLLGKPDVRGRVDVPPTRADLHAVRS